MIKDLKYFDGQLSEISRVPDDLKNLYQTCFEIDTRWLVEAAARRQKWIDQSQSLNLYIPCLLYTSPSPRDISGSRMPSSA